MRKLQKEFDRLKALDAAVQRRRKAWSSMAQTVDQCFADFEQKWKELSGEGYYIERRTNTQTSCDIKTPNANCVSLWAGNYPIGVGQSNGNNHKLEIEKGGSLLFSQCADGRVLVIATPPQSDIKSAPFKSLMIYPLLEPRSVNYSKVEHAIKRFLWLQRITGYRGFPTWRDRPQLFFYWLREWRHTNNWMNWSIFWIAVITFIFGIISTKDSIMSILSVSK